MILSQNVPENAQRVCVLRAFLFLRGGIMMNVRIDAVVPPQLTDCAGVIRESFAPVAERFFLTPENCPTHTSFITPQRLIFESQNGVLMYALYVDEKLSGFVGLDKREGYAVVEHLCVLPQLQRQGLGTMLLDFITVKAEQMGYKKLSAGLIDADTALKSFYERAGYRQAEKRDFPHLPFTVCYMEKDI